MNRTLILLSAVLVGCAAPLTTTAGPPARLSEPPAPAAVVQAADAEVTLDVLELI